jgi:hypothetical protein
MGLDPEAMRDLTPSNVSIKHVVLDAPSNLRFLYRYIKTRHAKESDGVVACSDAVIPGAKRVILFNTDHKGAHESNLRYNDQVLLLASLICCSVEVTRKQFSPAPPPLPARNRPVDFAAGPTGSSMDNQPLYPSLDDM